MPLQGDRVGPSGVFFGLRPFLFSRGLKGALVYPKSHVLPELRDPLSPGPLDWGVGPFSQGQISPLSLSLHAASRTLKTTLSI